MEKEKVNYLINYYIHLVPLEFKKKLKYPYLNQKELQQEKEKIAKIIIDKYSNNIILNYCSKCNKLTRTPKAKQCKNCFHSWH